ncbi:MAG: hypothetical protein IPK26_11435 [Planctomycetes bacterium]|nr:hypothetical protein [Planctomycetota bacterium]
MTAHLQSSELVVRQKVPGTPSGAGSTDSAQLVLNASESQRLVDRIQAQLEAARTTLATFSVESLDDLRNELDVRVSVRVLELFLRRLTEPTDSGSVQYRLETTGQAIARAPDRETYGFSVRCGEQGDVSGLAVLEVLHDNDDAVRDLAQKRDQVRAACREEAIGRFNNRSYDDRRAFVLAQRGIRQKIADARQRGDQHAVGRLSQELSDTVSKLGFGVEIDEDNFVARQRGAQR